MKFFTGYSVFFAPQTVFPKKCITTARARVPQDYKSFEPHVPEILKIINILNHTCPSASKNIFENVGNRSSNFGANVSLEM